MNPILAVGLVAVVAGVFFDAATPAPKAKKTKVQSEPKPATAESEKKPENKVPD